MWQSSQHKSSYSPYSPSAFFLSKVNFLKDAGCACLQFVQYAFIVHLFVVKSCLTLRSTFVPLRSTGLPTGAELTLRWASALMSISTPQLRSSRQARRALLPVSSTARSRRRMSGSSAAPTSPVASVPRAVLLFPLPPLQTLRALLETWRSNRLSPSEQSLRVLQLFVPQCWHQSQSYQSLLVYPSLFTFSVKGPTRRSTRTSR